MLTKSLKLIRSNWGFSQKDMADYLGVNKASWSNYERGIAKPDLDLLLKLSELTGISINDIVKFNFVWDDINNPKYKSTTPPAIVAEPKNTYEVKKSNLYNLNELIREVEKQREDIEALRRAIEQLKSDTIRK